MATTHRPHEFCNEFLPRWGPLFKHQILLQADSDFFGLSTIVKVILEGNFALILAVLTPPAASISVPNQKLVMANPPHT